MNAELAQVLEIERAIEAKPVLRALVDDIRRAADMSTGKRADHLDTWLAAWWRSLQNPRALDITQEQADDFRKEWEIPKS